ncbi:PAS domain-containing sensor histidine kinase [Flavitalea sp.]|nr:response regulator [Flavitalea sp.]
MSQFLRILHLEDLPSDADMVARELKKAGLQGEIFLAETKEEFIRGLTEFSPDIILSDHSLPSFDSHEALKIVKELNIQIPFILITATVSEEYAVNVMKEGASDYILKDRLQRLPRAITSAMDSYRSRAARIQAIETLRLSERKYKLLFEGNPLPMWMVSCTTLTIIDVNESAIHHYGYTREEFLAINSQSLNLPGYETEGLQQSGIRHHKKKNGDPVIVEVIAHEVLYENEPVILVLANDITDRLKAEAEIERQRKLQQKLITETSIKVQERERDEIGKELHDNINQLLVASKLYLQYSVETEGIKSEGLKKCGATLNLAIEEIRKLSQSLVAPSLGDISLIEAINKLTELISLTTSVHLELSTDNYREEELDNSIKLTIYRVIQEQINNIIKHARAKKAVIALSMTSKHICLTIRDDGVGFDKSKVTGGIGLRNMSNRAGFYDGSVNIISSPGQGCVLKAIIPLSTKTSREPELLAKDQFPKENQPAARSY